MNGISAWNRKAIIPHLKMQLEQNQRQKAAEEQPSSLCTEMLTLWFLGDPPAQAPSSTQVSCVSTTQS